MEGDAGSGQLTPTPPLTAQEPARPESETNDYAEDPGPPAPQSRLSTGNWLVGICAALLVASLVISASGVLAWLSHRNSAKADRDEVVAVALAKECITATQAPDAEAMAESQRKIVDCATENYAPQATLYSSLLTDAYETVRAQVKVTDMRAAAEKHNSDGSIDVLVATRVSMSNIQEEDRQLSYRLRVRMAPVDGTYKIDSIEPVSK